LGKPLDYFLGDERLETGKRVAFHRLAAETSAERRDWSGVREHVEHALREGPDPAERASLLYLLGRAEASTRSFERTFELIAEALALVTADLDPALVAQLFVLRGYAYAELGQLTAATESYEAARDVIERYEVVDPRLRSRALISLGTTYRRLGRTSKAIGAYESALTLASRSSEMEVAARGYMGIAATHYDSGELEAAIAAYRRALELFRRVEDVHFELSVLQSIATIQLESGEVATAKTSAERVLARAIEFGDARQAGVAEVILSRVALREGRPDEALRKAQHAEQILREVKDRIQQADALGAMGAAQEAVGRAAEADASYTASLDLYASVNDVADRSEMAAEYARVLRARGEMDKAFEMLELARGGAAPR
jgi:tetratricopeptide (TPR) repeat protein